MLEPALSPAPPPLAGEGCAAAREREPVQTSLDRINRRLLLVALLVLPLQANAADASPAAAYQSRQYAQAQTGYAHQGGYAGHFGAGAAAWRLSDYRAAAQHFSAALLLARNPTERSDALYNLGNALYGQGAWRAAAEAFAAVLQARPNDARASKNLEQAKLRLAKQRTDTPFQSDLRGRRGRLAEGIVNLDWDTDAAVQDFAAEAVGPMTGGKTADGARLQGLVNGAGGAEVAAARLQSGRKKLELLNDKPRELLKGMMRQDRVPGAPNTESAPW